MKINITDGSKGVGGREFQLIPLLLCAAQTKAKAGKTLAWCGEVAAPPPL